MLMESHSLSPGRGCRRGSGTGERRVSQSGVGGGVLQSGGCEDQGWKAGGGGLGSQTVAGGLKGYRGREEERGTYYRTLISFSMEGPQIVFHL